MFSVLRNTRDTEVKHFQDPDFIMDLFSVFIVIIQLNYII
jgi:hypothetical protein